MRKWLIGLLVTAWIQPVWAGGYACPYGGYCPVGFGSFSIVLYLLTLVLGYWVIRTVEREKPEKTDKPYLKKLGLGVGWLILVVSLFGLLCKGGSALCRSKSAYGPKPGCHFAGGPQAPPEAAPAQ